jgi:hypothetical protein
VVTKPERLQPPSLSDTGSYVLDIETQLTRDTNL